MTRYDDVSQLPPHLRPQVVAKLAMAKKTTKPVKKRGKSKLEAKFLLMWRAVGGAQLASEHRFHPTRRWRLDFAHTGCKVAIELEGGVWSGGRHTRGSGFVGDCEKYNAATLLGWRLFRLATGMVTHENVSAIAAFVESETRKQSNVN